MSYDWTRKQIETILQSMVSRLEKDKDAFTLKKEDRDKATFSEYGKDSKIYVSIEPRYIYISLNDISGSYTPWWFVPFADKKIKFLISRLIEISNGDFITVDAQIYNLFPEAVDQTFEDDVLKKDK